MLKFTKAVKDFQGVTGSSDKVAKEFLSKCNNDLETALDAFFSSSSSQSGPMVNVAQMENVFSQYAGSGSDADLICDDKLLAFLTDLKIDPEDNRAVYALAWKLKCKSVGEISRKEFADGFGGAGCDSLAKMAQFADSARAALARPDQFKAFYRWTFDFCKEDKERKALEKEQALELWLVVLDEARFKHLRRFVAFLQKQPCKQVAKDLWDQLLEFATDIKPDLSNWSDDGAWPVTIDDFVQELKKRP